MELAAENSNGSNAEGRSPVGKAGLQYAWTSGDLDGLKLAIINRQIGFIEAIQWLKNAVLGALNADIHMQWCWRDPVPSIVSLLAIFPRFSRLRRAVKRVSQPAYISGSDK